MPAIVPSNALGLTIVDSGCIQALVGVVSAAQESPVIQPPLLVCGCIAGPHDNLGTIFVVKGVHIQAHAIQVGAHTLVLRVEGRREDVAVPLLVVAGVALPDRQANTVCCVAARHLKAFEGGSIRPQPALVVPHPLLSWCAVAVPDLHNSSISYTAAAAATSTAVSVVMYTRRPCRLLLHFHAGHDR